MFHKVKTVSPLPDFRLSVQFSEGVTKLYDVKPLFEKLPVFTALKDDPALFGCVSVDVGGYGIIWETNWTCPVTNCGNMVRRWQRLLTDCWLSAMPPNFGG